ncbi:(2Fe-2S)-binding protein [Oceanicoccus sp. KOV_DT_Chl]|uniref:(2Fe-2S)-binding protein n=1 Tax=Oceanicoccus sp. KOV_DT_Chl TaxID=1904639 RepID=UPI000C7CDD4E|nr:(2Fe-2S)-binding protein [Oceanicoccus sp. KOV_DT_Chl]
MFSFTLNGEAVSVDIAADTPLLWTLRDHLQLNGTKFGCGAGLCGACTVLIDGQASRSCILPVAAIDGKNITTIEGLGGEHPVQQAWIEHSVAQCGYCQSGQIMSTVALLASNPQPTEDEIKQALAGNICRCGTYPRILSAITSLAHQSTPSVQLFDPSAASNKEIKYS